MGSVIKVLSQLIKEKKSMILRDVTREKEDLKITAVHQLLSVLPKSSSDLLPKGYKRFYNKLSKINPLDFDISKENTYKSHQSYAIIPSINVPYVNQLMEENDMKISKSFDDKEDLILYKKSETPKRMKKRTKITSKKVEEEEDGDEYSVSLDELL
tara:strand:- start:596 stop:1063 length:468 start_codon:yes stop_codon:yes gene_type:complete